MSKAKEFLDDWIAAEKILDRERLEVITALQKKIEQIQAQRTAVRYKIIQAQQLYEQHKLKQA